VGAGHLTLDIADPDAVRRYVAALNPSLVINAAAYTAVDQAEGEPNQAHAVNAHAVASLAAICRDQAARLIHVSTDFVFDGAAGRPYRPEDPVGPLNVYGQSKLEGERALQAAGGLHWLVIRTAWVYASTGRNFVSTMLRLFRERASVAVVADQVGTPTSARSLARCLWRAAAVDEASGVLHFTDSGVASWYDFAVAIYEEAKALGLLDREVEILPIRSEAYVTRARRPAYSVLDKQAMQSVLGLQPAHWRVELRNVLKEMKA
jgi:dTDP-4-dehydrorhamnose reductase